MIVKTPPPPTSMTTMTRMSSSPSSGGGGGANKTAAETLFRFRLTKCARVIRCIETLQEFSSRCWITFSDQGIYFQAVNTSSRAACELFIRRSRFDQFTLRKASSSFFVNLTQIHAQLKGKDDKKIVLDFLAHDAGTLWIVVTAERLRRITLPATTATTTTAMPAVSDSVAASASVAADQRDVITLHHQPDSHCPYYALGSIETADNVFEITMDATELSNILRELSVVDKIVTIRACNTTMALSFSSTDGELGTMSLDTICVGGSRTRAYAQMRYRGPAATATSVSMPPPPPPTVALPPPLPVCGTHKTRRWTVATMRATPLPPIPPLPSSYPMPMVVSDPNGRRTSSKRSRQVSVATFFKRTDEAELAHVPSVEASERFSARFLRFFCKILQPPLMVTFIFHRNRPLVMRIHVDSDADLCIAAHISTWNAAAAPQPPPPVIVPPLPPLPPPVTSPPLPATNPTRRRRRRQGRGS